MDSLETRLSTYFDFINWLITITSYLCYLWSMYSNLSAVCLSVCPEDKFRTHWPLIYMLACMCAILIEFDGQG